ncbi:hypothetical protein ACFYR1_38275 [Streptomyces canus]
MAASTKTAEAPDGTVHPHTGDQAALRHPDSTQSTVTSRHEH